MFTAFGIEFDKSRSGKPCVVCQCSRRRQNGYLIPARTVKVLVSIPHRGIGALEDEVREIISRLYNKTTEKVGSIEFNLGELFGKRIVIARCGVGKVFAAICAEAMIIKYSPSLIVNSGVGGALDKSLRPCDIVFAD